jgi:hydroxyacylglutathione hydrolase
MVKLLEYITGKKVVEVHQLLAGREFAKKHPDPQIQSIFNSAKSSANFVYCIVVEDAKHESNREASLIDPAWDVDGIFQYCHNELNISTISSSIFTHWHPDHIGGFMPTTRGDRLKISGIPECIANGCPSIYFGVDELKKVQQMHKLNNTEDIQSFHLLNDGDQVSVNGVNLDIISTPGHTIGSICVYLANKNITDPRSIPMLITGDTLFIGSCGRFEQNKKGMRIFHSINRLSLLPDKTMVCPGHNYAGSFSDIGQEKLYNSAILQGKKMMDRLNEIYGTAKNPTALSRNNTANQDKNQIQIIPLKKYTDHALFVFKKIFASDTSSNAYDKCGDNADDIYFVNGQYHTRNNECTNCFPVIDLSSGNSKI